MVCWDIKYEPAIKSTADNIAFAFHISWPWILMLLPLSVATNVYVVLNGLQLQGGGEPDLAAMKNSTYGQFPLVIASICALCFIAVN